MLDELKIEDLMSLKDIYDESFSKNSDIDVMKKKFSEIKKLNNTKMLCVRENNELVGFLKCDIIDDFVSIGKSYMFLSNLCVSKRHREKGYSTILMNEAERIAKNLDCEYIFLTCGNEKVCAHAVYKKMGYNVKNSNIYIKYL